MIKCENYRGNSLLSIFGKIYADILVDRVCSLTGGLTDDEQGGFGIGRGYVEDLVCCDCSTAQG